MVLARDDLAYRYPTNDLLRDGTAVVFRPATSEDRDSLIGFARALNDEDLLFLREDITSPDVVDAWIADMAWAACSRARSAPSPPPLACAP